MLLAADFLMKFEGNKYNGEDQVIQVLKDKQKYTDDVSSDDVPQEGGGTAVHAPRRCCGPR